MKLKFTLSIFGLFFAMFILMSNSGGRAAGAGEGNTGAPGDDSKTCATCHMGGNFGTSIAIEVINSVGETVTAYIPGEIYTINATVNTTTAPAGYGLQLVSLIDGSLTDTEGLSNPSANAQIVDINDRTYLEQNALSSTEVFSAEWKAPAASTGGVTFYAAGHAANGNNAAGGDESAQGALQLTETISAIDEIANLGLVISPNPASDFTTIELANVIDGSIELFDISGIRLMQSNFQSNQYTLDISNQNTGIYFVKITDLKNNVFETMKVIKN